MRNLQILPEDVLVVSEFRYSELKKIQYALAHCTVAMNLAEEKDKEAHDFFINNFNDWVNGTVASIEGNDGS